ncbi:hypothetical protein ACFWYW_56625 [Nonomuraea sp. NPDC059023]|uniref:hypothetical protein n=1 Tax=unclassified Nonomuraea TaxID=2593643 RepID=UPI0036C05E0B
MNMRAWWRRRFPPRGDRLADQLRRAAQHLLDEHAARVQQRTEQRVAEADRQMSAQVADAKALMNEMLIQHPAVQSFAIQTLYDRYGARVYARMAGEPAFAAEVGAHAYRLRTNVFDAAAAAGDSELRQLREDPTLMVAVLLGCTYSLLVELLDDAVEAELDGDHSGPGRPMLEVTLQLGALFQLGFEYGLISMTPPAHR